MFYKVLNNVYLCVVNVREGDEPRELQRQPEKQLLKTNKN